MNDVLKQQEPAFLKLTDSAEALLQAMEGLMINHNRLLNQLHLKHLKSQRKIYLSRFK